jgi:acyl-CoA thioester hydrolase
MIKPYFPSREEDPLPLRYKVERRVRFEEVDALGIVWHGRYSSFFEDARAGLGERYGVGYMDFYRHKVVAPIKRLYIDYDRPLKFEERFMIEAILHWSDAARINVEFIIRDNRERVTTTGYTVQMMLDFKENPLMVPPPFYLEFRERWKSGALT